MDRITEKIEYMLHKKPDKVAEFVKQVYHQDPEIVERMLDYPDDAEHIPNRRKYDELVEKIRWEDGNGRGAKWSFEDIKKQSRIDFDKVDYTEYDYAYLVNMLYAKCCRYITDPSIYLKLAKCLLEDRDEETRIYRGHNYNQKRYKERGAQNHYPDYTEEDRRYRHTRSEMNDPFEDRDRRYRNENDYRRTYNNDRYPQDSYYRDNHVGFSY